MEKENQLPKRKDLRLKNYDYSSNGAYFITICTKDRAQILSTISKPVGVGALDDPQIQLTNIGKTIEKYLLSSEKIPRVHIDNYILMPDHVHVIIFIDPPESSGQENGSSKVPTPTNEIIPHVISTFKRFCNKSIGRTIFQRGYFDRILRNREDYEEHLRYIHNNPMNWLNDKLYPKE